jgi:hypothetical protein
MVDEWEAIGVVGDWAFGHDLRGQMGDSWCFEREGPLTTETWFWCLHCGRLQQLRTVRIARNTCYLCSFDGCDGSLIDLVECDPVEEQNSAYTFPAPSERVSGAFWGICGDGHE